MNRVVRSRKILNGKLRPTLRKINGRVQMRLIRGERRRKFIDEKGIGRPNGMAGWAASNSSVALRRSRQGELLGTAQGE